MCYDTNMENLVFSLNATMPIFIMMVLGYFFKYIHLLDDHSLKVINKFVFVIALPVLMFEDLAEQDIQSIWNGKFILFCFVITLIEIGLAALISLIVVKKENRGEFVQASYRSSAALLGAAIISNIYGESGIAALMIVAAVPLYNICAVIVLSLTSPDNTTLDSKTIKKTLKGIITNPILIGIVIGFLWSILKLPYPTILQKSVNNIAKLATPLGLMAMGGSLEFKKISQVVKPACISSFLKLFGFAMVFVPVAIWFGFRESELIAIVVMLGSATTVSCYVMAQNMKHEGTLTSAVVMITTLLSSFSLTFWLWLLKTLMLI